MGPNQIKKNDGNFIKNFTYPDFAQLMRRTKADNGIAALVDDQRTLEAATILVLEQRILESEQ